MNKNLIVHPKTKLCLLAGMALIFASSPVVAQPPVDPVQQYRDLAFAVATQNAVNNINAAIQHKPEPVQQQVIPIFSLGGGGAYAVPVVPGTAIGPFANDAAGQARIDAIMNDWSARNK